jgi:hypothetical protein
MPISFTCKCGTQLRAKDEQAGKRLQCPACGRALVIPAPTKAEKVKSAWEVDDSPGVVEKAEQAGVARHGRASVALVTSAGALEHGLTVEGTVKCWHCHTTMPFTGKVFGRPGLGGTLANLSCPKCRGTVWMGFSSRPAEPGTEVFLYAPSHTRDYEFTESKPLPAPTFAISRVAEAPTKVEGVEASLSAFLKAVSKREPYQEVSGLAAKLVGHALSPTQTAGVCRPLRALLEQEQTAYLSAVLAEALASLRDASAAEAVQAALRRALEVEDPADQTNLPLHDLCVLALLFGDGEGFQQALERGLKDLPTATRACKWGKRLTPKEVSKLLEGGSYFDSFESTLGGANWQHIYPLVIWKPEPKKERFGKGWLKGLFRPGRAPRALPRGGRGTG